MNLKITTILFGIGLFILAACNSQNSGVSETIELKTTIDSVSYGLGVSIGENMIKSGMDSMNYSAFATALYHVFEGKQVSISEEDANALLNKYFSEMQMKKAEKGKVEGKLFLENNAKAEGIVTLPSGLQYKVLKTGTGPKPTVTDKVSVHYTGKLLDGKVFDSSVERNEPASFEVGGVIAGWTEALQLMNVGSKWELYIPSELGYGERGAGGVIPPHATLIFEVELLSIDK